MSNCNFDHFLKQKFPRCPFISGYYKKNLKNVHLELSNSDVYNDSRKVPSQ